jgi:anti-sigma-K factor RskA
LRNDVTPHSDLPGYALGSLSARERAAVEQHLATCATCRGQLADLTVPAGLLRRAAPSVELPPGLRARTLAAIERAADDVNGSSARPLRLRFRHRPRRLALAAAAAVVVAGAVLGGMELGRTGTPGELELRTALASPGGGAAEATVTVRKTGIGRVIAFRTDDLPILPKGEYYELWFVGPGDKPGQPNRISAGTFHPDKQGRSHADFTAAVDPAEYPGLSVTAEPGDGNPARTGPEVLRSTR